MDPDKPKQTRREAVIRFAKASLMILIILALLVPYALAVICKITQGSWPVWSGFGDFVSPIVQEGQEFHRGITLWDLTQLLIIPVVLALAVVWFNRQERKNEREIAAKRDQTERDLATDRIEENALQSYLDRMTELLLEKGLRDSATYDEVRSVARSRTLTVLRSLGAERKGEVLRFLYESGLLGKFSPVVILKTANLVGAYLSDANLENVNLSGAYLNEATLSGTTMKRANLNDAYLVEANLVEAELNEAELVGANLEQANLGRANLSEANLHKANLHRVDLRRSNLGKANLSDANLSWAYLRWTDVSDANLIGADLHRADLRDCINWTHEQLNAAASLENAKLPEGYTPPNRTTE